VIEEPEQLYRVYAQNGWTVPDPPEQRSPGLTDEQWRRCQELRDRHNAAVDREEIETAAVEKYRKKLGPGARLLESASPTVKDAVVKVMQAEGRSSHEVDESLRNLSRVLGRG
jgi:hypothetical protein